MPLSKMSSKIIFTIFIILSLIAAINVYGMPNEKLAAYAFVFKILKQELHILVLCAHSFKISICIMLLDNEWFRETNTFRDLTGYYTMLRPMLLCFQSLLCGT